jgi:uncharacterized protein YqjF (DUF2071 family)
MEFAPHELDYRLYPPPSGPFVMHQTWRDLCFMHWPLEPGHLDLALPRGLPLDTFNGVAYLGVVPFTMTGVRLRAIPPLPWLSEFPELNVRTYVTIDDKPGVYFFSLDAANPVAVRAARALFSLNYRDAVMACENRRGLVHYASTRTERRYGSAYFRATYWPAGDPWVPPPGSLEYWLTARYCLYAVDPRGRVLRAEIHHAPWQLFRAGAEIETNTMGEQIGIDLSSPPPLLHCSIEMPVVVWLPGEV